jgi:peptidyl-prolyl cis-trans isomerase B (cyclophilin B)
MSVAVPVLLTLFSILIPLKTWFAPSQPLEVKNDSPNAISLMLTTFTGQTIEAGNAAEVEAGKSVDAKTAFPQLATPGTYILYAVPKGKSLPDFIGTPLVIGVREDKREGAQGGPIVTKAEPLRYAVATTAKGPMTMVFYYDVAPNTADSFLSLATGGYFDGLTFHRIVPGFVIQGGDPRGDGTGGPGYMVDAEFSDAKDSGRVHDAGSLSMARTGDPGEAPGVMPRPEFANSAGSQFFVCLNYENTRTLDGRYTLFGKVTGGMEAINKIAQAPLADDRSEKPREPQVIQKVEVKPVTKENNPYPQLMKAREAAAEVRPRPAAK